MLSELFLYVNGNEESVADGSKTYYRIWKHATNCLKMGF